ncbi:MAG TPA: flagellar hook-associated protein FlgK [Acidobacteriota bacterium]|nr:flagellar hook-associated protein FlgK [Acidobacteriota bacterium]
MPGLFQGLEIGKRALLSHQVTLQTIGHNIANVDTPGYTRQRVRISSALPETLTYGSVGMGIQVDDVRQVRDLFLGQQYREANKAMGQWTYKQKTMSQIESLFNEPQDNSLNDYLNQFWDAWSDLSTNSDSSTHRQMIRTKANQFINGLHQLAKQLTSLRDAIDRDLTDMTKDVNRLTAEISQLNQQIKTTELGGRKANDLRDARDRLIDELSNVVDVRTVDKANGANIVYMGAMVLVDGSDSFDIDTVAENEAGVTTHRVVWKGTDVTLANIDGQLAGLTESRDEIIPRYLEELNALTRELVERVNTIHRSGYGYQNGSTDVAFFDPRFTDAATIRLNADIEQDINKIAASSTPDGDNLIALQLSDLRDVTVMTDNTMTFNDYYSGLVGGLGVESREATSFSDNYELLRYQVENARQSVQGVSLDEEMTNLVKFQHAYDAAARVITVMDEALDVVIGAMGIVGR